ncbi:unnamed protein product [Brachionus calyciflorus]|uniref:Uncharacterized protein n=1 Tax=Brachionus calyciflorus TaxID=104777 RepID=A0A813MAJ9_9BILA|nr:unnamed protein product [Brachionus calyciflorus]
MEKVEKNIVNQDLLLKMSREQLKNVSSEINLMKNETINKIKPELEILNGNIGCIFDSLKALQFQITSNVSKAIESTKTQFNQKQRELTEKLILILKNNTQY